MSVHAFYRLAVWLPIALPSLVAALFHGLGLGPTGSEILTLLLASLVYGGLPYAPIALFATFWIDGRPEAEIRRRAVRAPFWMIVSFLIFCVVLAIVSRQLIMPAGVFVLGAIASLALGYLYVVIVFAMRDGLFGPYEPVGPPMKWRW